MSTNLRLHATPGSLYSAKVRIALLHKGLHWEEVAPDGGYRSDAYRSLVPQGSVPALEVDGALIVDSEAIVEYLEEAYPAQPLLPSVPLQRAQIRSLSRYHDTAFEPAVRALFPSIGEGRRPADDLVERINTRLAILGRIAQPSPLLGGAELSMADLGYPVSFASIDIIAAATRAALVWPDPIRRYQQSLDQVPAVAAVLAPYRAITTQWAAAALGSQT
ncbi:glutathione S-transferase family protein [Devosia epidermidihirudinis]|uniref:glutathione S-transferase family protein n=1 Tax=Devosia epidermidihirudinis TaxID=1293439 RepID=UPI000697F569|nr:glutathione S-transferase family protein [Devosia epidermidihirudinis]